MNQNEKGFSTSTGEKGVEDLWRAVEADVRRELDELFFSDPSEWTDDAESLEDVKERMVTQEAAFMNLVIEAADEATAESGKKCIALFDVDETMGYFEFTTKPERTILRPVLKPVLEYLRAKGISIGLLSSRGLEAMQKQLGDQNHLAPVAEFIDRELVFSSRDEDEYGYGSFGEGREKMFKHFADETKILDRKVVDQENTRFRQGDITKIMQLAKIREKVGTDSNIICVDDFPYPKYLDRKSGLYGVCVAGNDGSFHRP